MSAISAWEVAMLEARDRLSFTRPVDDWIHAALRALLVETRRTAC